MYECCYNNYCFVNSFTKYMSDLMPVWVTNVRCTTTEQSDGDGGSETVVNEVFNYTCVQL